MTLLAGDIGGTKTTLAIFASQSELTTPLVESTFSSAKYSSFESVVRDFLSKVNYSVDLGSFGVAGPVFNGRSSLPNLPWVIDELELEKALKFHSVFLLNDLLATAMYIPLLPSEDYVTLSEGRSVLHGTIGVIAPGTGLGEAFLSWDGTKYHPHASEGGHCDFAPRNPPEIELLRYLSEKLEHVSYERVCSGLGLREIYAFFHKFIGITEEHEKIAKEIAEADDPTPVIVNAGIQKMHCELCVKTLYTFVEILGAEAGNLALKVLAMGGIYLAGGIPTHLLPVLQEGRFMQAFKKKGRMSSLVANIPVHVVMNPKIALFGAAKFGYEMMMERKR